MSMTKVWNITDAENSPVKPLTRMVLGRAVKPGRSVQVEEAHLEKAHKVHKDRRAGLLYIGRRLPAAYMAKKKPPRAFVDARRVNEAGMIDHSSPKVEVLPGHKGPGFFDKPAEAEAPTEAPVEEPAHMTKPMVGEEVPAEWMKETKDHEETVEEAAEREENEEPSGRKHRKGRR